MITRVRWQVAAQAINVDFDRPLKPEIAGFQPSQMSIVIGGQKFNFRLGIVTGLGEMIGIFHDGPFSANLPDGFYYRTPPFLYQTPDFWPVPRINAFPVQIFP